ncbi:transposase [Acetobacter malorum]|uniref:transposase n=1 Tax=Acetobacter malorum TaxID=178901 RepID=UPI0038D02DD2
MAAYARQHRSPCPFTGYWDKKGAHSEAVGRSRSAFTSKVHVRCDNHGSPLGFVLTGSQVSVYKATDTLIKLPLPNPRTILTNRGYDSDCFRQELLTHRVLPVFHHAK